MKEETNIKNVVEKIKGIENGVSEVIVPMLKDRIEDYKRIFNKMFILLIVLLLILAGITGYSLHLIYEQNIKYQEFLSQFEFEGEDTVYQETDNNSTINDGITINK